MFKKVLSWLLLVSLLLTMFAFTGCTSEDEDASTLEEEEDRTPMSVDLWIPCNDGTTEESKALVMEALNEICELKYSTHVEIHFIPSSQYEETISKHIEQVAEAKERADEAQETAVETTGDDEDETTEAETKVDEYGVSTIVYPDILASQMDIFLIRGYEDYSYYAEMGELTDLDSALTEGDAKRLKTFIYPTFLKQAKIDDTLYGIPNNTLIGEYSVLLVSKSAVEELNSNGKSYDPSSLNSPKACQSFIKDVATKLSGYTPVKGTFDMPNVKFWNESGDSSSFSLLASDISADATFGTYVALNNIFDCSDFTDTYYMNKWIKENNYSGNGSKFAVATMTGTYDELQAYAEDYYITTLASPTATQESVCENVFAVSQYTRDLTRSVEIITLINTNETFRTILQYGVEGVHWKYTDDTKTAISQLAKTYNMNLDETGNAYLTYPGYGKTKEVWESWKTQNLESVIDPYFGFDATISSLLQSILDDNTSLTKSLTTKRANVTKIEAQIDAFDSKTQTKDELNALKNNLASAKRSVTSTEEQIEANKTLYNNLKKITSDSKTFYSKIQAMSSSEFASSLATLKKESSFLYEMRYLLSVETFNDYVVTSDTKVVDGNVYYYIEDNEYKVRRNLLINTPIKDVGVTLYSIEEADCSYSLANMIYEYWQENK